MIIDYKLREILFFYFFIFFIFSQNTQAAAQNSLNNYNESNSAVYYLNALNLLKFPESQGIVNNLKEVIEKGWIENNKELEKILIENNTVLNEFKKGLIAPNCDFSFGKKYELPLERYEDMPSFVDISNLVDLVLLNGRFYEVTGDNNKAIKEYLSLCIFVNHISMDYDVFFKMLAINIEIKIFKVLKNHLSLNMIDKEGCDRISNMLDNYKRQRFPYSDIIRAEKQGLLDIIESTFNDPNVLKMKFNNEIKNKVMLNNEYIKFKEEIIREICRLQDKYFDYFIKAADTNKESDWDLAEEKINKLKDKTSSSWSRVPYFLRIWTNKLLGRQDKVIYIAAKKVATILFVTCIPNFRRFAEKYYSSLEQLDELRSIAIRECKKIHFISPKLKHQ